MSGGASTRARFPTLRAPMVRACVVGIEPRLREPTRMPKCIERVARPVRVVDAAQARRGGQVNGRAEARNHERECTPKHC